MKKIIIPTDFSSCADNAMKYGLQLARIFKTDVELVHVFYPAMELNTGYIIDETVEVRRQKKLKDLQAEISSTLGSDIEITTTFIHGFPIEEIVALSSKEEQMIVMGATGSSGVFGRLFGSVSSHVVKMAACPVCLVPTNGSFKSYKQIMYASDKEWLDKEVEPLLMPWLEIFTTKIHVVHVTERASGKDQGKQEVFDGVHPDYVIRREIASPAIVETLNKYIDDQDIDLVVLSTRRRTFWNRLVHVSITREMALKPSVPILVFHEGDH